MIGSQGTPKRAGVPLRGDYFAISKSPLRVLRRGVAAKRLRILMTCAAYHRPPLGDRTLRALSIAATAAAGSSASSSKMGRNRSARSIAAGKNL
jgi:hypothetical protein